MGKKLFSFLLFFSNSSLLILALPRLLLLPRPRVLPFLLPELLLRLFEEFSTRDGALNVSGTFEMTLLLLRRLTILSLLQCPT